ncbi:RdgB/HAM1 family non-canonical purine NTP pyrophosphatase [Scatolibacter rhodanostii]|uniref:RdgB/HAM1 family non-canonical purine NTP pyrophosphatase n=1 Tax=Scatolibacter rhodanostii TaxID=2014781 RepID=UPI000C071BF4|nr:RdgB/HAM1 family non-canonical purine NTP pyrophosphatase [Scatolibacter rhodanostii]
MKLVIATHNQHKVEEFQRILAPLGVEIVTADISEPIEDGITFAENAKIKAESACKETSMPAVADDSGICVDALDGAPGVYSARYGGEGLDDVGRLELLLANMEDVPAENRQAHFTSAICCVFPNGDVIEAEGKCFGTIAHEADGEGGFGYDPIFMQEGLSFGRLSPAEKDKRSHRGKSLREFAVKLNDYLNQEQR